MVAHLNYTDTFFWLFPSTFLALKVQLVSLVRAFMMVSTVWSVSCLLFFYSRCRKPCQAIYKSGARGPPCLIESVPLPVHVVMVPPPHLPHCAL